MTGKRIAWWMGLSSIVLLGPTLLAQAASQAVGEAITTHGAASEWGNTGVWAFLSTSALEWLKRHPSINLLSERTAFWVQRGVGVLLAIATAAGIHASFDASTGVLTVSGLLWSSAAEAIGESVRQFCANEVLYRLVVKPYKGNNPTL